MGRDSSIDVRKRILIVVPIVVLFSACLRDASYELPESNCIEKLEANITYDAVKALAQSEVVKIQEDWILEGYIISSDDHGNFYNSLHIQDREAQPGSGFQIEIDMRDSHLFFELGDKIFIRLKGLFVGASKGIYKIGSAYTVFGNRVVDRIPGLAIAQHIVKSCEEATVLPMEVGINALDSLEPNTLIRIQGVEIIEEEVGLAFAVPEEETKRRLTDCQGNELVLLNSGYADFQEAALPGHNGSITGVYYPENKKPQIRIRALSDLEFDQERCPEIITEFTSDQVFISEIADPDNNSNARFIELHYAGADSIPLNGWTLRRYTNENTTIGATIDLSAFTLNTGQSLVIASNATEFQAVYGFLPDLEAGSNSPADSNGDDTIVLADPFDTVIDIFGVVGEDGSGTNHEFEDGRAVRKSTIAHGNPIYTFSEWTIYNDTGGAGTINQPQNAPQDYTPGFRD